MGNLFGKSKSTTSSPKNKTSGSNSSSKKNTITEKDRAILDLKIARDKLTKYQKRVNIESEKLLKQAQILLNSGHKDRALLTMKIRKHKMKEVDTVDSKLITVMQMIEDIEWESHNIEVLNALKSGTAALNKLHEEMSIEDVEKLLEETNEAIEIENEISTLLAGQFSAFDESELEAELEALVAEEEAADSHKPVTSKANPQPIKPTPQQQQQQPELPLPDAPQHTPVILPDTPTNIPNIESRSPERLAA